MVPEREFAVGDRVRPKTGGPVMVVESVYAPVFKYRYRCQWADKDGLPQHELFRAAELEAADDTKIDGMTLESPLPPD